MLRGGIAAATGGREATRAALRIAGLYALVAGAWIVLSDRLLAGGSVVMQTAKGLGFVLITALLLFALVHAKVGQLTRIAQATRRSEARYAEAQRIGRMGHWQLDTTDRHMHWSEEIFRIFGLPHDPGGIDHEGFLALVHEDDRPAVQEAIERAVREHGPLDLRHRIVTAAGSERWVWARGELDAGGAGTTMLSGTVQDVTELVEAQRVLQERADLQEAYVREVTRAREAEAERIARDIHDELGQALTGIKFALHALREQLGSEARAPLSELLAQTAGALDAVRRISAELRPPLLRSFGLVPALEKLHTDILERAGLQGVFDAEAAPRCSGARAIQIYRVAQEALTNVVRHARASRVDIELRSTDRGYLLAVRDDGAGLEPTSESHGFGLLGMRERAALIGARLDVGPAPAGGVSVELRWDDERAPAPEDA